MPVLTCGGMRIQQSWNRRGNKISRIEDVDPECQANLVATLRASLKHGINHFETAQGYGSSEIQFGEALNEILKSGEIKREDIILQTKVSPKKTAKAFREALEVSFDRLKVDKNLGGYVDLLSFHGVNRHHQVDWVCGVEGSNQFPIDNCCMRVIDEYKAAGKIRHVGFSTHAMTSVIIRAIKTELFSYVNLHYHYVGSYTASGCGELSGGNEDAIAEAAALDMGVFIISGNDKGGKLYRPSAKIARLCAPELDPIKFNFLWLMEQPSVHTMVIGAARPTDFDDAMAVAPLVGTEEGRAKVAAVDAKLKAAAVEAHGETWANGGWFKGVPDCYENDHGIHMCNIIWLHFITKAWGLHEFSIDRYGTFDSNARNWNWTAGASFTENASDWGYSTYHDELMTCLLIFFVSLIQF